MGKIDLEAENYISVLEKGFDPSSLTKDQLRSCLSRFDAPVPPKSDKKAVHIEYFNQHIVPKSSELKKKLAKVKPSARGITAVSIRGSPDGQETERIAMHSSASSAEKAASRRAKGKNPQDSSSSKVSNSSNHPLSREINQDSSPLSSNPFQQQASSSDIKAQTPATKKRNAGASRKSKKAQSSPSASSQPEKFMVDPSSLKIAGFLHPEDALKRSGKQVEKPFMGINSDFFRKLSAFFSIILFASLLLYLAQWRTIKYCSNTESYREPDNIFLGIPYPLPSCRACPQHAECRGLELKCERGFLLKSPVFPFHPFCAPDMEKLVYVERFSEEAGRIINEHAGLVECGEIIDEIYMTEDRLKKAVRRNKYKKLSEEKFNEYWEIYMDDVEKANVKNIKYVARGDVSVFRALHPTYPVMCRITKFIHSAAIKYRNYLISVFLGTIFSIYVFWKYQKSINYKAKIDQLVETVIQILIEQDTLFKERFQSASAVSVSQLRDFCLPEVRDFSEKTRIWNDVRNELLLNSSVRETTALVEGEEHDAWQWIGSEVISNMRRSYGNSSPMNITAISNKGRNSFGIMNDL